MYIYDLPEWSRFDWDGKRLAEPLADVRHRQGRLISKYAKLGKCSQDTALRDILAFVERDILVRNAEGGRSTSYALAAHPKP
jgi:Fic family protein